MRYSRSTEGPCQQQSTLPAPEDQPKSVSDPLPSPAPCAAVEAAAPPRHEDPPAAASPAAVNQRDHSDSSEGSSPSTAPFQSPAPAATPVAAPPPAEPVALQEKAEVAVPVDVIKIEDAAVVIKVRLLFFAVLSLSLSLSSYGFVDRR